MKLRLFIPFFVLLSTFGFASDVYFASASAGSNNGTSCANAYAYNDGTHGISKATNWAAGNKLHVCGTISVAANTNVITAQASGSAGNVITVKYEPGAIVQSAAAGTGANSLIVLDGFNFITIDGGNTSLAAGGSLSISGSTITWLGGQNFSPLTNGSVIYYSNASSAVNTATISSCSSSTTCTLTSSPGNTSFAYWNYQWTGGLAQNYANGSTGQTNCPGTGNTYTGSCANQSVNSIIISANNSSNITIQNLGCVVTIVTAGAFGNGAPGNDCVNFQGSNVTFNNNQFWHAGTGIDNTGYHTDANTVISGNDFNDNGWAIGCAGNVTGNNTNYQISGNKFYNWAIGSWAATGAHVNGIHCYDGSGGGIQDLYLFNNVFDTRGSSTTGWTTLVYLQSDATDGNWSGSPSINPSVNVGKLHAFNNIFIDIIGLGNAAIQTGGGSGHEIFQNTFWATTSGAGSVAIQFGGGSVVVESNAIIQSQQLLQDGANSGCCGAPTNAIATMDYNAYGEANSGNPFLQFTHGALNCNSSTLTAWRSCASVDAHTVSTNNAFSSPLANITQDGFPSAGYIGTGAGIPAASLTTICNAYSGTNSVAQAACLKDASLAGTRTTSNRLSSGSEDIGAIQLTTSNAIAPTCTPSAPYSGPATTVTLTDGNSGTHVTCYTTNGSTPATNGLGTGCTTGTQYSSGFAVNSTETVMGISGTSTLADSSVTSCQYTIGPAVSRNSCPACGVAENWGVVPGNSATVSK